MRTRLLMCAALFALPSAAQSAQSGSELEPLRALIWRPTVAGLAEAEFIVNRPAYVAVFEIVPGRGAGLLYPSVPAHDVQVDAGSHAVFLTQRSHRWFYRSPILVSSFGPSRYLLIVASEAPLRLESVTPPSGLHRELGVQFGSWGALGTMGEILALVAPSDPEARWTYDVHIDGIAPQFTPRRFVWVQCGFRAVRVPIELLAYALEVCRNETRVRAADASTSQPLDAKADARKVKDARAKERRWLGNEMRAITARDRWDALVARSKRGAITARDRWDERGARSKRGGIAAQDRWPDLRPRIHRVPRTGNGFDHLTRPVKRSAREWKGGDAKKETGRSQ